MLVKQSRLRILAGFWFALCALMPGQQISNKQIVPLDGTAPERDFADLFKRVSHSDFVVMGTVARQEAVSRRLGASDVSSLDANVGGILYAISVEKTVCRKTDFMSSSHNISNPPKIVSLFFPSSEPRYVNGHDRGSLKQGQRYLLFLVKTSEQNEWTTLFRLDRQQIYYQTEERSRGIVPVPGLTATSEIKSALLEKITPLCDAVREPRLARKLSNLNKLAASPDVVVRKEAEEALQRLSKTQQ